MAEIWIKICGITRNEDARAISESGADAIGLVCYPPSRRYVPPERFAEVLEEISGKVEVFALFVDADAAAVRTVVKTGLVTGLQFHGGESAGFCESFGLPYMKALRVRGDEDLPPLSDRYASARNILLDTWDRSAPGGTGKTFPWKVAATLVAAGKGNIVLAGGLHAGNVLAAIHGVRPWGIDTSSGVEIEPGVKDLSKVTDFIKEARNA